MIKHSIRLTSFLTAFFILLLVFQYHRSIQQEFPFDTTDSFNLNIPNIEVSKEELIQELNNLTSSYNGVLVKIVPSQDDYEKQKDIVWFGLNEPFGENVRIEDGSVKWLESGMEGTLIPASVMGIRPLYGSFSMRGSSDFKEAITKWANEHNFQISWTLRTSAIRFYLYALINLGIGNAVLTASLLFFTSLISWYIIYARMRAIRFLGGINKTQIHIEDSTSIMKIVSISSSIACVSFLVFFTITNGLDQVCIILPPALTAYVAFVIVSGVCVLALSFLLQPKTEHLTHRDLPFKRVKQLQTVTLVVSFVVAMLIIPRTLTTASIVHKMSKEYSLWETMQKNVRISFNELDALETDRMLPFVESFFSEMEESENLCLSLAVDKAIVLSEEEMDNYDHIIIADKAWVESFNIGIETQAPGGMLTKISFDELGTPLKHFITAQLPLWTITGEIRPSGIDFYQFTGEKFLALSPNVGYGGSSIQATNPFVILVDKPTDSLKTKSFLLPAASTGNIVFPDEKILREGLTASPIQEKIASIDSYADAALEKAQRYSKEAIYYFSACIMAFFTIGITGIMNAQLWVASNRKRLFTLRTSGKTYWEIFSPVYGKEILVTCFSAFAGGLIAYFIQHPNVLYLWMSIFSIFFIYAFVNTISLHNYMMNDFYQTAYRKV